MTSPRTSPQARDLELAGLRLRLWDHAPDARERPLVLFLHGYLDTGRSFDPLVAELGDAVRALCLDWRGHGCSDQVGAGGSYHPLDHLKDLARVLDALERSGELPDLVVAHSMGGSIALMMAGVWPEKIKRLLLLDAFGPPSEDAAQQPERLSRALKAMLRVRSFSTFDSHEAAVARLMETNFGLSRQGAEHMARHAVYEDPDAPGVWRFRLDARLRGPTPLRYPEETWLAVCRRVTASVLVLRATKGYLPQGELLQGRLEACRGAELRHVESVHHLHVEVPEVIAQAALELLG